MEMGNLLGDGMGPHFSDPKPIPPKSSSYEGKADTLSIQITSDVHLEFYTNHTLEQFPALFSKFVEPVAPYLALLGDIGFPGSQIYREFLAWCGKRFDKVLVVCRFLLFSTHLCKVLGNHEFYKGEYFEILANASKDCTDAGPNVIFCNRQSIELHNHLVLATTLWSLIPEDKMDVVRMQLSDYHLIDIIDEESKAKRALTPKDTVGWYNENVAWIKKQIEETTLPVVILTHHAPSLACSEPDIPPSEPAATAFCSPLDHLFEDPVIGWGFGHTHFPMYFKSGTCQIISNPAGYPKSEFPTPYNRPYNAKGVLTV